MTTAASQNLEAARDRLRLILSTEIPRFASEAHHPPPILDTAASEGAADSLTSRKAWDVPGLKKLETDMGRELARVEKFLQQPNWRTLPTLSTNATYMLAVWDEVIASRAVLGVCKTFNVPAAMKRKAKGSGSHDLKQELGVKVDVISEDGKKWTRINTLTAGRFLRELYELDGSGSGSDESSEDEQPTFGLTITAQPTHNSLITMGKLLLDAAQLHPVPGDSGRVPDVCIRLTRLGVSEKRAIDDDRVPNVEDEDGFDDRGDGARIQRQVDHLRALGIQVQLGERAPPPPTTPIASSSSQPLPSPKLFPTLKLNLDLSILIALTSDITHAPLPSTPSDALERFKPTVRTWDKKKHKKKGPPLNIDDKDEIGKHVRSLAAQIVQEMTGGGLINTLRAHLDAAASSQALSEARVELWTTPSAKDRCFRIIAKIGGEAERRRAHAMFEDDSSGTFWNDSRYESGSLPGLPIRLLPSDVPPSKEEDDEEGGSDGDGDGDGDGGFWTRLSKTCHVMLVTPAGTRTPIPIPETSNGSNGAEDESDSDADSFESDDIPQDRVQDATSDPKDPLHEPSFTPTPTVHRMTTHTAQSLLWGAHGNMTTLTANKASVKSVLKEMRALFGSVDGGAGHMDGDGTERTAAIWVVEPRSLAEGMRKDAATNL